MLDTSLKNGHTSTTDSLWAGVPVVAMLGERMGSRVSVSAIRATGGVHGEVVSVRDFEET